MNREEYQKMFSLEDTYWWFVGRRSIIDRLLTRLPGSGPKRLLDLGCGTGANLFMIGKHGEVVGMDASHIALEYAATRKNAAWLITGEADHLPFADHSFDVISCLDVLEHLPDDDHGLREIRRVLRPDGFLILTVPAYPWLWSEHDEALGHHRRYTKHTLAKVLRSAGIRTLKVSFAISVPLLPTAMLRLWQRLWRKIRGWTRPKIAESKTAHILLPSVFNRALIAQLQFEGWLLNWINLPFGVSIIVVARPEDAHNGDERGQTIPSPKF